MGQITAQEQMDKWASADTDSHIPDQLFLFGQDQVQVGITLVGPPGSWAKKSSQEPPDCCHRASLHGQ